VKAIKSDSDSDSDEQKKVAAPGVTHPSDATAFHLAHQSSVWNYTPMNAPAQRKCWLYAYRLTVLCRRLVLKS